MTPFYSFDTGPIMNGRRDLYRATVFKGLWEKIEGAIAAGEIRSIQVVRDELDKMDDDASRWAKAQNGLFVPIEEDVQNAMFDIMAAHPKLVGVGGARSGADPFVIALAMARNGTVVTEERATNRIEKPKIPDVCKALSVRCLTLMDYIAEQGWVFG